MSRPRKARVTRERHLERVREDAERHYREVRLGYRARDMARIGIKLAREGERGAYPSDPLAGSSLGLLRLRGRFSGGGRNPGGISERQYNAGEAWAKLCRRHAAIMGYELKPVKSLSDFDRRGGRSVAPAPPPDLVEEVRDKWSKCYEAIMDECKTHGLGVRNVTYAVCIEGVHPGSLSPRDYGDLRTGLNALARVLIPLDGGARSGRVLAWKG